MERVADAYRPDVEASLRTLEIGPCESATISGDGELLALALANLIENAIRHTQQGARIGLSILREGSSLRLSIADDGPGIPEDRRADVLQAYAVIMVIMGSDHCKLMFQLRFGAYSNNFDALIDRFAGVFCRIWAGAERNLLVVTTLRYAEPGRSGGCD